MQFKMTITVDEKPIIIASLGDRLTEKNELKDNLAFLSAVEWWIGILKSTSFEQVMNEIDKQTENN